MRERFHDLAEKGRHRAGPLGSETGETFGHFTLRHPNGARLFVIAVAGRPGDDPIGQYDHASVSVRKADGSVQADRCPTWEELCWVKDLFWGEEECVVQYHPPKSRYVNQNPFVLHLWRPTTCEVPMPPLACV